MHLLTVLHVTLAAASPHAGPTSNADSAESKCPFLNSLESLPLPPKTNLPWYKWPLTLTGANPEIQHELIGKESVVQGPFRAMNGVFAATADLAKQVLNSEGTDTEPGMLPHMSKQACSITH